MSGASNMPRVTVVGGGLAGLAAAAALARHGVGVDLFEARRRLGGRATSFRDPETDEVIDHCQHVAMGCCTNFLDFCRRTQIDDLLRRDDTLHFFLLDGQQRDMRAIRWLPAPLHLLPSFVRNPRLRKHLGSIGRAMRNLWRTPPGPRPDEPSMARWLAEQRQAKEAIESFWLVVLSSALAETLDRIALSHARKVFVDGFLTNRQGYELIVPTVPLAELYGDRLTRSLEKSSVTIHLQQPIRRLCVENDRVTDIELGDGSRHSTEAVVLALPWRKTIGVIDASELAPRLPELDGARRIEGSPITSVHVWLDRPITTLPHAVLSEVLPQWIFRRQADDEDEHYYQIVISGSREIAEMDRESVKAFVLNLWSNVFPAMREARVLRFRVVTDREAVFSVAPGIDSLRPRQATSLAGLTLAGDWTTTGWPATMEGAVRSGYLAAETVLERLGRPAQIVVPDLPRGRLARLFG